MIDPVFAATSATSPLSKIMNASGKVGYFWDIRADHIIWFGEWQKLFGFDRTHPPYNVETFSATIFPEDRPLVFGTGATTIDRNYRIQLPDGSIVWVNEQGSVEVESTGPARQCGMITPIGEGAKKPAIASDDTTDRDALTRRPNRDAMIGLLNKIMMGTRNERMTSIYFVIGIDKMAFVNEAIGIKSADQLLCNVATRIVEMAPVRAQVARVGGDLFGVLLPGMCGRDYPAVAEKILDSFRNQPVPTTGTPLFITVSIGALRLSDDIPSATDVMIRAEQALNEARLRGRNVLVEYQSSTQDSAARRHTMEMGEKFKYALKNNQLKLAFQPIIDSQTGQVVFYEALVRMFKENGDPIPAAEFVPAVEELGLALDLDYHVLDLTLHELETYPDLRLAMNISGLTAARADWPDYISLKLKDKPEVARRLIIEITETLAITDITETQRFADTIRKMGSSLAIDDFGSGSTSIKHLRNLPLSIMKIDRELLTGLIASPEQQHLVRMMIAIAHGLSLKTVAEGVETEDVAMWLKNENADMMQGYYFGRPSIERPWHYLKGADMSSENVRALFGNRLPTDGPAELHVNKAKTLK